MLNVISVEGLDMFLISADQEEISGMDGIDRNIWYATIVTNLVTLQESAETKT